MIKKLTEFATQQANIIDEFKQYLADETIPIAERWYTFTLFCQLLPTISYYENVIYFDLFKAYNLKMYDSVLAKLNYNDLHFIDLIKAIEEENSDVNTVNTIKNLLLKTGCSSIYMD
jgi:hypothetical protein